MKKMLNVTKLSQMRRVICLLDQMQIKLTPNQNYVELRLYFAKVMCILKIGFAASEKDTLMTHHTRNAIISFLNIPRHCMNT